MQFYSNPCGQRGGKAELPGDRNGALRTCCGCGDAPLSTLERCHQSKAQKAEGYLLGRGLGRSLSAKLGSVRQRQTHKILCLPTFRWHDTPRGTVWSRSKDSCLQIKVFHPGLLCFFPHISSPAFPPPPLLPPAFSFPTLRLAFSLTLRQPIRTYTYSFRVSPQPTALTQHQTYNGFRKSLGGIKPSLVSHRSYEKNSQPLNWQFHTLEVSPRKQTPK